MNSASVVHDGQRAARRIKDLVMHVRGVPHHNDEHGEHLIVKNGVSIPRSVDGRGNRRGTRARSRVGLDALDVSTKPGSVKL